MTNADTSPQLSISCHYFATFELRLDKYFTRLNLTNKEWTLLTLVNRRLTPTMLTNSITIHRHDSLRGPIRQTDLPYSDQSAHLILPTALRGLLILFVVEELTLRRLARVMSSPGSAEVPRHTSCRDSAGTGSAWGRWHHAIVHGHLFLNTGSPKPALYIAFAFHSQMGKRHNIISL